jgi:hypothetical protein
VVVFTSAPPGKLWYFLQNVKAISCPIPPQSSFETFIGNPVTTITPLPKANMSFYLLNGSVSVSVHTASIEMQRIKKEAVFA